MGPNIAPSLQKLRSKGEDEEEQEETHMIEDPVYVAIFTDLAHAHMGTSL